MRVKDSATALQLAFHVGHSHFGRRRLALCTGLSEMAVRLELERLRGLGLVRFLRSGTELTRAGQAHFASLFERVRAVLELELTSLRLDHVTLAAHITIAESSPAWTIRDRAIREGATGLVLLRFSPEGWKFSHNNESVADQNPRDASTIETMFPKSYSGDRLILVSGPDHRRAGLGLWHAIKEIVWTF